MSKLSYLFLFVFMSSSLCMDDMQCPVSESDSHTFRKIFNALAIPDDAFTPWADNQNSCNSPAAQQLQKLPDESLLKYKEIAEKAYEARKSDSFRYGVIYLLEALGIVFFRHSFGPEITTENLFSFSSSFSLGGTITACGLFNDGLYNICKVFEAQQIVNDLTTLQYNKKIIEKYAKTKID